jgi:CheY-like chemotaxis protein
MEDPPDVVLMDVNLEGGREGIEAARWIREVCDIPVVFITAYTDRDTLERIHEYVPGAAVIAKTLYRERLAMVVKEAVALVDGSLSGPRPLTENPRGMSST